MQAIILAILMGGRKTLAAFFVGSLLLAGNAVADAKKGVPTKLERLTPTPVAAPPVPVPVVVEIPKEPTCVWVPRSTATYSPGTSVLTQGILASVCGCCGPTQIWAPGIFAHVPGTETVTISYEKVCK